jgi:hypothetical protein
MSCDVNQICHRTDKKEEIERKGAGAKKERWNGYMCKKRTRSGHGVSSVIFVHLAKSEGSLLLSLLLLFGFWGGHADIEHPLLLSQQPEKKKKMERVISVKK